jgi:hypothetical protein
LRRVDFQPAIAPQGVEKIVRDGHKSFIKRPDRKCQCSLDDFMQVAFQAIFL